MSAVLQFQKMPSTQRLALDIQEQKIKLKDLEDFQKGMIASYPLFMNLDALSRFKYSEITFRIKYRSEANVKSFEFVGTGSMKFTIAFPSTSREFDLAVTSGS